MSSSTGQEGKRPSRSSKMNDRISVLPDNVISDQILLRLNLHDAVRTSILSRGWRYKWTMIPDLRLDSIFFDNVSGERTPDPAGYLIAVNSIIMQHTGPLDSFGLFIPELGFPKGVFDQPIHFILRKGVKSFTLWSHESIPPTLPFPPSPCLHLENLKLHACAFNPPLGFAVFPNLKFLSCCMVSCSATRMSVFIRNCVKLEKVKLLTLSYLDEDILCIQASNLRHLVLFDESFPQLDIPNVVKLHICLEDYCAESSKSLFSCSLANLQDLTLGCYFLKSLSSAGITELSQALIGLTSLTADTVVLDDIDELSCLLCLIRSSPNLDQLNISLMSIEDVPANTDFELEVEKHTDWSFDKLTHVKISIMIGTATELKFIRFILAHSPALRKLSIKFYKGNETLSEIQTHRELLRSKRASPVAEIVFLKPAEYANEVYSELED